MSRRKGAAAAISAMADPSPIGPQADRPASIEALRHSLSWWLIGTGRMWRRLLDERLKFSSQTQPRWRVLAWARLRPGIPQTELAERLDISGPTLVRILDGLARQGMIERRESREDRRVKEIYLTQSALPLVEAISAEVGEIRDYLLQDVSQEEMLLCLDVFERIRARTEELSTPESLARKA